MKFIVKGKQPPALIAIHKDKTKTYENDVCDNLKTIPKITVKSDTLESLMKDQGYICCYCMQKIYTKGLTSASPLYPTIEHYIAQHTPQSKSNNLDTDYKNMLVTCHGNDKKEPDNKHCDSSRGGVAFKYLNPLDKSCEKVLGYGADGSIICLDDTNRNDIEHDIKLLNLNYQKIKDNRKSIMDGIKKLKVYSKNKLQAKWNKEIFKNEQLSKCVKSSSGEYKEYVQVIVYVLSKL